MSFLFYLSTLIPFIHFVCIIALILCAFLYSVDYLTDRSEQCNLLSENERKKTKWVAIVALLVLFLVPSKQDMMIIIFGGSAVNALDSIPAAVELLNK